MPELDRAKQICLDIGFSEVGDLDVSTIQLLPEVRQMCEQNTCRQYGKNWCCPPGVGSLQACQARIDGYHKGILVQTVGELEDELDGEGMMEAEADHRAHFEEARKALLAEYPGLLAIGAGTCTRCRSCTYPDAPCRFPDNTFGSMEAYGMLVTQVCQANGATYYHGPRTITYTSCFLLA